MLGKYLACCFFTAAATCLLANGAFAYTGQELVKRPKSPLTRLAQLR
jgi:hypothetical protein